MRVRAVVLGATAGLAAAAPASAAPALDRGPAQRLSGAWFAGLTSAAPVPRDRVVLGWTEAPAPGDPSRVRARVAGAGGRLVAAPVTLSPAGPPAQEPLVAGGRRPLALWTALTPGVGRLVARPLDAATGRPSGPPTDLGEHPGGLPSVAPWRGGWAVAHVGGRLDAGTIAVRLLRVDRAGRPRGEAEVLERGTGNRAPAVAVAARRRRLAVLTTTAAERPVARLRIRSRGGTLVSRRLDTGGDLVAGLWPLQRTGGWLSLWVRPSGPDGELVLRALDARGRVERTTRVRASRPAPQSPAVAFGRGGRHGVLAWAGTDRCGPEVRAVPLDGAGRPRSDRARRLTVTGSRCNGQDDLSGATAAVLARAGARRWVLGWTASSASGDRRTALAARLSAPGR